MAGLACADRLRERGIDAVLFDKGKRPGGRLSTLRLEDRAWDFGCQYVMPGAGAFAAEAARWRQAGLVAPWRAGPPGALVGVPAMASLIEGLCAGKDARFGMQVQRLDRQGQSWCVSGPGFSEGPFAAIAIAIPAEQAAALLSLHDLALAREAASTRSSPCWTVMAGFDRPLAGLEAFLRDRGAIAWAARNNSKPGRGSAECWVIQAGPQWSQDHQELDRETVAARLLALFAAETGQVLPPPSFLKAHRWRFALSYGQPGATLWNAALQLGACGDWCMAPQVEGAWRAGRDLADRIMASLAFEAEAQPLRVVG